LLHIAELLTGTPSAHQKGLKGPLFGSFCQPGQILPFPCMPGAPCSPQWPAFHACHVRNMRDLDCLFGAWGCFVPFSILACISLVSSCCPHLMMIDTSQSLVSACCAFHTRVIMLSVTCAIWAAYLGFQDISCHFQSRPAFHTRVIMPSAIRVIRTVYLWLQGDVCPFLVLSSGSCTPHSLKAGASGKQAIGIWDNVQLPTQTWSTPVNEHMCH